MNFEIAVVNAANAKTNVDHSSRLISCIYGILWMLGKEDLFDKFLNRVDFSFK